jgi:hypothetical protein
LDAPIKTKAILVAGGVGLGITASYLIKKGIKAFRKARGRY